MGQRDDIWYFHESSWKDFVNNVLLQGAHEAGKCTSLERPLAWASAVAAHPLSRAICFCFSFNFRVCIFILIILIFQETKYVGISICTDIFFSQQNKISGRLSHNEKDDPRDSVNIVIINVEASMSYAPISLVHLCAKRAMFLGFRP